nr:alpha/beta hydrolase [Pelagibacterium montanilacus]
MPGTDLWRGMDRAELDQAYDNSGAVSASADFLADWSRRSAALRARQPELVDLAYGSRQRNRIDIFRSGADDAPLLVFIHGGYWQRNSKEIFSCMAEGMLGAGVDVALPGYTLAPEATLAQITQEVAASLGWLRREGPSHGIGRSRLIVSGWSAGGHLAAGAMALPEVDAGLAVSGIYDLEPIRRGVLNDKLGLTPEDVAGLSPILAIPETDKPLAVAWGTAELPELQRQSRDYAAAWGLAGRTGQIVPVAGANHFSILEDLARPGGALARRVLALAEMS